MSNERLWVVENGLGGWTSLDYLRVEVYELEAETPCTYRVKDYGRSRTIRKSADTFTSQEGAVQRVRQLRDDALTKAREYVEFLEGFTSVRVVEYRPEIIISSHVFFFGSRGNAARRRG